MNAQDFATQEAIRQGVDPDLVLRMMLRESGSNANVADSSKGAIGPMQLMPGTAKDLGVDPRDPLQNIQGGIAYLKQQLQNFGGNVAHAVAAYNAGPGAVKKHGGVPPYKETMNYVRQVLGPQDASAAEMPQGNVQQWDADIFGTDPQADAKAQPRAQAAPTQPATQWDADIFGPEPKPQGTKQTAQQQQSPQPAPKVRTQQAAQNVKPASWWDSFTRGGQDTVEGIEQRGMDLVNGMRNWNPVLSTMLNLMQYPVTKTVINPESAAAFNAKVSKGMQSYKASRGENASTIDGWRLAGNIISNPFTYLLRGGSVPSLIAAGAATGAMQPIDIHNGDYGSQLMGNVGLGALFSVGGAGLGKVANGIARPMTELTQAEQAGVKVANDLGVKLTPGQLSGRQGLMTVENQLSKIPGATRWMKNIRSGNQAAINSAAADDIGQNADYLSPEVLDNARQAIGKMYNSVYSPQQQIPFGEGFQKAIDQLKAKYAPFGSLGQEVNNAIDKYLSFTNPGQVPGDIYQGGRTMLKNAADNALYSASPNTTMGQALKEAQGILQNTAANSLSPEQQAALAQADKMYSAFKALTKGKSVTGGNVNPQSVASALQSYYGTAYKTGKLTGNLPKIAQLAEANKNWNPTGDSGTATRTFVDALTQHPISGSLSAALANIVLMGLENPATSFYLKYGIPVANQAVSAFPGIMPRFGATVGGAAGAGTNK